MARRLHTRFLEPGLIELDAVQSHHARHVLRLEAGEAVEVFDDAGRTAGGTIEAIGDRYAVRVAEVLEPALRGLGIAIAAAVPKGDRADWMIEKLSELGCVSYTPLIAERSVVTPKGTGKRDRWVRLATESAKQCRRVGVMRIDEPLNLSKLLEARADVTAAGRAAGTKPDPAWFLDLNPSAIAIRELLLSPAPESGVLTLLVGPEGGWTEREVDQMLEARLTAIRLGKTVLRVETAAVAAAACVGGMWIGS